ncbi:MAG: hypothetical protein KatS3mg061_0296 [Dehalococcoidia bacterium]|nr:MAG: hypothetical protein KatS3mg061_0296 [Dehalococcoidia bacterium]
MPYITPSGKKLVTVIPGDGVGPEVVRAAQRIIAAAGVPIEWEERRRGRPSSGRGETSGVPRETRESIERTRVVLKGPLETPVGFGEKSANVTLRKLYETYANVRPARELPGVPTRYAGEGIDLVVVRENIEDLYAGIEHMQTAGVGAVPEADQPTRAARRSSATPSSSRVREGRKSEVDLRDEGEHHEADGGAASSGSTSEVAARLRRRRDRGRGTSSSTTTAHQLVRSTRAQFDVIVTTNLNGDIISDLASGLDRRARLRPLRPTIGERGSPSSRLSTGRPRSTRARTSSTRRR